MNCVIQCLSTMKNFLKYQECTIIEETLSLDEKQIEKNKCDLNALKSYINIFSSRLDAAAIIKFKKDFFLQSKVYHRKCSM